MYSILFVCTGNTCRSPMAAALAAEMFRREGLQVAVSSAGVNAYGGSSASKNAVLAMEAEKICIKNHKSQAALIEILEKSSLVLAMTRAHLSYVKKTCPAAKAVTLGEYAGNGADISDPFGGSLEEYLACAAQIKSLLENCMDGFKQEILQYGNTGNISESEPLCKVRIKKRQSRRTNKKGMD